MQLISRRIFIGYASALGSLTAADSHAASSQTPPSGRPLLAYVGTYSSPQGPEGSKGRGEGIYLFEVDSRSGALRKRAVFPNGSNPSWIAFNPAKTCLYAANENTTFNDANTGSVSAYSIDRSTGSLTLLNTVSSGGAGPAHLSVHPSGKYVLVANYAGGTVAVLPIGSNGQLGSATDIKRDRGPVGPTNASSAPPGSFAISGHDRPHAHMIQSDPSGQFVLSTDLATDQILIWKFNLANGKLSPAATPSIALPPGDGPRHFAFHPDGRRLYSLQEESSTIALFDYNPETGKLLFRETVSSLPPGFGGTNFTSEIMISPDAKFIYAANRLHDSIAWFSLGAAGALKFAGETWTRGDYPRSFNFDPIGRFLYSCNQRSDAIACFRVDRASGNLTFTGQYTPVGTPAIIVFLPV